MHTAHPDTRIGHVHLKVADLDRSIQFYQNVMGLNVTQRYGDQAAFLSAGGYHHHIGLNTWFSKGSSPVPKRSAGLFHVAFVYPDRKSLAEIFQNALYAGVEIEGAADHGVSEALYFSDPDENGIEIYRDRPADEWPRNADGELAMINDPLDLNALSQELD